MYDGDLTIEEKYRSIAKDTHEKMENTIQMAYQCNDLGDQVRGCMFGVCFCCVF